MTNAQNLTAKVNTAYKSVSRNRVVVVLVFLALLAVSTLVIRNVQQQYVAGANVLVVNGNTRDDPTLSSPDLPAIATSTIVLDRVEQALHLDVPLLTIKKHLAVKVPAYRTSILRVEYSDSDAARAAQIANGVADELTRYFRQISTARYDADLAALDTELSKQSRRIKEISSEMQAHAGSAVTSVDDKGNDPVASRLTDLLTARELAQATLHGDVANADSSGAIAANSVKAFRHDVLLNDQRYHDLLATASSSELALAVARTAYTENNPEVSSLERKVKALDASLERERRSALAAPDAYSPTLAASEADRSKAEAQVIADQAKVVALNTLIAGERSRQAAQTPLETLRLQLSAAQADYLTMSSHRATALANRADALSLGSAVVVDRAIGAEAQAGLGVHSLEAILALLSLALAFGSAFLADHFNPHMRRVAQIESLYGRPVVATLGRM
jgi:capsular polysaccharide biosynthesis protein